MHLFYERGWVVSFYFRWRKSNYTLTYTGSVERDEEEYPFLERDLNLLDSVFSDHLAEAQQFARGPQRGDDSNFVDV